MILVTGEALIDVVHRADGSVEEFVGGGPMNVAVGLARLEVETLLLTQLGADDRGRRVLDHLTDSGVEVLADQIPRTATATARLDGSGVATYTFDLHWTLAHRQLPACDALHVGSLGSQLEPGRESVVDLVDQAWGRGTPVSYDPNIRAALVDDPASTWSDLVSLAERSRVVKLSDEDVEVLHPGADPGDIARSLLAGEATELVLLTRGPDGASAFTGAAQAHRPARPAGVVDTVGAGDSFMAATLAALFAAGVLDGRGQPIPDEEDGLGRLLEAALEAAAVTCSRPGADPPALADLRPGWPG